MTSTARAALLCISLFAGCTGEMRSSGPSDRDAATTRADAGPMPPAVDAGPGAGTDAAASAHDAGPTPPGVDAGPLGSLPPTAPPFGGSSAGSGGRAPVTEEMLMAGEVAYWLVVPSSYHGAPTPLLVFIAGSGGPVQMINTLDNAGPFTGTDDYIRVCLAYTYDGNAGAAVIDELRRLYNIDNDRTFLISESAGTMAGLDLGFHLREEWFAAYWANDVVTSDVPARSVAALGFAPWGNSGPGGNFPAANAIVDGMRAAGYRIEPPAPYDGPGADMHGSAEQGLAAIAFMAGKSRR